MNHTLRWAVPLLALSLAPLLAANAAPPEPGAAASAVAPYRSAFADYKPWSDIAPGDWRRLNASAVASPMAGMAGMHDMAAPAHSTDAMPGMTAASHPSHGHAAMHGSAGDMHDGHGDHPMPGMKGMSSPAAPAASAPHAGHSMPGGHP